MPIMMPDKYRAANVEYRVPNFTYCRRSDRALMREFEYVRLELARARALAPSFILPVDC